MKVQVLTLVVGSLCLANTALAMGPGRCRIQTAEGNRGRVYENCRYRDVDLRGMDLSYSRFVNCTFENVDAKLLDLDGVRFESVAVRGGSFEGSRLRGSVWVDSQICGADLSSVDWRDADRAGLLVRTHCDEGESASNEFELKSGFRQFRAEGEHMCQSLTSLGHTCTTSGVSFADCREAYFALKADSCCSRTEYGGSSIDFKLTTCTAFH